MSCRPIRLKRTKDERLQAAEELDIAKLISRCSSPVLILLNLSLAPDCQSLTEDRSDTALGTVLSTHNQHNRYDRARGCTLSTAIVVISLNF